MILAGDDGEIAVVAMVRAKRDMYISGARANPGRSCVIHGFIIRVLISGGFL
jgi:hypothetical protein